MTKDRAAFLTDGWQRANGVAELAMRHRGIAEAKVEEQRAHIQTLRDDNDALRDECRQWQEQAGQMAVRAESLEDIHSRLTTQIEKARAELTRALSFQDGGDEMAVVEILRALLAELGPSDKEKGPAL